MKTFCFWIVRSISALEKTVSKTLTQDYLKGTELKRQQGQATLLRWLKFREAAAPQGHFCPEGVGPYLNLGSVRWLHWRRGQETRFRACTARIISRDNLPTSAYLQKVT